MSANDSDKKQWSDPKDYGLPFVEITPISTKTELREEISEKLPAKPTIPVDTPKVTDKPIIPESIDHEVIFIENPGITKKGKQPSIYSETTSKESSSSSWIWAVAIIGLGIIAVIVWQIQSNKSTAGNVAVIELAENPVATITPEISGESKETTVTDQNQTPINQDSIQVQANSIPNISKPAESGTTIANTATGNLIRIESKTERPQYFIIVGSLPSEQLAMEETGQYFGRSAELYLISPYDGGKNYRLALYNFGSFKLAAEKLEEIKSQYTEELWILKY